MQPFDLGNNIGRPILTGSMDEELLQSVEKIRVAAKENEKSSGIYSTSGDQARAFADQGFNMVGNQSLPLDSTDRPLKISEATDAAILPTSMTADLTAAKGSYVHTALNVGKGAASSLGQAVFGSQKAEAPEKSEST